MKKWYIALNKDGEILTLYDEHDIDIYAAQENGNRNPFELFSGSTEQDTVDEIKVCNLTEQGLIYIAKLDKTTLEEVSL